MRRCCSIKAVDSLYGLIFWVTRSTQPPSSHHQSWTALPSLCLIFEIQDLTLASLFQIVFDPLLLAGSLELPFFLRRYFWVHMIYTKRESARYQLSLANWCWSTLRGTTPRICRRRSCCRFLASCRYSKVGCQLVEWRKIIGSPQANRLLCFVINRQNCSPLASFPWWLRIVFGTLP